MGKYQKNIEAARQISVVQYLETYRPVNLSVKLIGNTAPGHMIVSSSQFAMESFIGTLMMWEVIMPLII